MSYALGTIDLVKHRLSENRHCSVSLAFFILLIEKKKLRQKAALN